MIPLQCTVWAREHLLGSSVWITGTLALVLENNLLPGYLPPAELKKVLHEKFITEKTGP